MLSAGQAVASWFPPDSEEATSLTGEQKSLHTPDKASILVLHDCRDSYHHTIQNGLLLSNAETPGATFLERK